MVRMLASHQCGLGSNPGTDAKCGLLLVLVLAPRVFHRVLSPSTKPNISKFQFDLETMDEEPLRGYATAIFYLIYFYFIYFIRFGSKLCVREYETHRCFRLD